MKQLHPTDHLTNFVRLLTCLTELASDLRNFLYLDESKDLIDTTDGGDIWRDFDYSQRKLRERVKAFEAGYRIMDYTQEARV